MKDAQSPWGLQLPPAANTSGSSYLSFAYPR
jgi:hypothetical protein